MKRSLIVLFLGLTLADVACAQSSVTLYGAVDAGLLYVNNSAGGKLYTVASGNMQGSRFGFRGMEDLESGLQAIFVLENGFSVANGRLLQGGDEFGRQAYVGIRSKDLGTITFGRQYDLVVDYVEIFASANQWASGYNGHPGDLDNMTNSNRANNSVKYQIPSFRGLSAAGLYSFGGVSGNFNKDQIWSVGASYANGPVSLAAAFVTAQNPNISYFGNNATSSATGSNMTSPVYSSYSSSKTQQIIAAGAAYAMGSATFGATYSNVQFKDFLLNTTGTGSAGFNNFELNAKYQVTPAVVVGLAGQLTDGYQSNRAKYLQGAVGVDYFLSKRTDLYADAVYQHAKGTDSTGQPARANINFLSPSASSSQLAVVVGVRHKF